MKIRLSKRKELMIHYEDAEQLKKTHFIPEKRWYFHSNVFVSTITRDLISSLIELIMSN